MDKDKPKKKTLHLISTETGTLVHAIEVADGEAVDPQEGTTLMDPETQEYDPKRKLVRGKTPPKQKTLLDLAFERIAALEKRVSEIEGKKVTRD